MRSKRSVRKLMLSAVAAGLGILLAACGSSSPASTSTTNGSTASSASTNSSASASTRGKTITVGISYPSAGPDAIYSNKFKAARLYLQHLDKQGGINGYKFSFKALNNSCTAAGGASAVRQLLASNPFMIWSSCSDSFSGAISSLKATAPNTPVILDGNAALIKPSGLKYVYGTSPSYIGDCYFLMKYARKTLRAKKVGILYDEGPNAAPATKPCSAYGKSIGVKSVKLLGIPSATSDFAGLGAQVANSGVKAWIAFCLIRHLASTQKAAASAGYTGKWLVQSSNFSYKYLRLAGSSANGSLISSYIEPPHSATTPAANLFKKIVKPTIPAAWGVLGAQGWSAGYLVAYGVRQATANGHKLTRASFEKALNEVSHKTLGLMPDLTYSNGSSTGHVASGVHAEAVYKVENGKYVRISKPAPIPAYSGS